MTVDDDAPRGGGFLSGWSRRKLAAKRGQATDDAPEAIEPADDAIAPDQDLAAARQADVVAEEADPDIIENLPSLDDITAETDLAPFMQRGVPAKLRNAAMRRMWLANPLIRDHVDPALDYAWDWNAPGGVPGGGGVLHADGVARMVDDLLGAPGRDRDGPERTEREEVAAASADGADSGDPAVLAARDDAMALASDAGDSPGEDDKVAENRLDDEATADTPRLSLRRHGGAVPD